jgi:hypothetical protein
MGDTTPRPRSDGDHTCLFFAAYWALNGKAATANVIGSETRVIRSQMKVAAGPSPDPAAADRRSRPASSVRSASTTIAISVMSAGGHRRRGRQEECGTAARPMAAAEAR